MKLYLFIVPEGEVTQMGREGLEGKVRALAEEVRERVRSQLPEWKRLYVYLERDEDNRVHAGSYWLMHCYDYGRYYPVDSLENGCDAAVDLETGELMALPQYPTHALAGRHESLEPAPDELVAELAFSPRELDARYVMRSLKKAKRE